MCYPLWVGSVDFHPRTRVCWQRWKHHGIALTLISSSQCTHWCIDCHADQLETSVCHCLVELKDSEQNFIRLNHWVKDRIHFFSLEHGLLFQFLSGGKFYFWLFSSVKCCKSTFKKEVLNYCSSHDDNLSSNTKACSSLLHILSLFYSNCSCLQCLGRVKTCTECFVYSWDGLSS